MRAYMYIWMPEFYNYNNKEFDELWFKESFARDHSSFWLDMTQ